MAAVLSCGPDAVLSHASAAKLWGLMSQRIDRIQVTVLKHGPREPRGVAVSRRPSLAAEDLAVHQGIPVTAPVQTLIDLATTLGASRLERAVNEADRLNLVDPESLRAALVARAGRPGVPRLRKMLDRRTFRLTASELERLFLPLAASAGLPPPLTRRMVNGFEVDFHWPDLGLVVETDGLRYHRTPAQQARDRVRDQTHAAAGLTPVRFTHEQVKFEPAHVRDTLVAVAARLFDRAR